MELNRESYKKYADFDYIAGIDEVGRGPLAGPVTAAAVILPKDFVDSEIGDSKKLTEKKREALYGAILEASLAHSIVSVGHRRVDELNIREASRLAMLLAARRVQQQLGTKKIKFLIDGNVSLRAKLSQETIIKGDSKVFSIAAASILAKVARDRLMGKVDSIYPGYQLARHKGYPTKAHKEAIQTLGPTRIHRQTFSGVKEFVQKKKITGLQPASWSEGRASS